MLSVIMESVIMLKVLCAQCHLCRVTFAIGECHYAECRYAECHGAAKFLKKHLFLCESCIFAFTTRLLFNWLPPLSSVCSRLMDCFIMQLGVFTIKNLSL
jgi:hypothetical protein